MKFLKTLMLGVVAFGIHAIAHAEPNKDVSGTLPVIYVNTEDNTPIVDKETQIPATLYMDASGIEDVESVGSEEDAINLTIKGRGNSSWLKAKKPYKLKFAKKTSLFGLPKNKHYVLLANFSSYQTWLAYELGFELSRNLKLRWTPSMYPVELVLNGNYEGVYFLCESIKVADGRLDITEQEDGETDPEKIPYGWLIEIDNGDEENQIKFNEDGKNMMIRFTFQSPEELSDEQYEWIDSELRRINSVLYTDPEKNDIDISTVFDIDSFVKYFIIREILNDYDGFSGSFYIYRNNEDEPLWTAGPMWDLTMDKIKKEFYMAYDPNRPEWSFPHWFGQFMKYPCFEEAFKRIWKEFYTPENIASLHEYLRQYGAHLQPAFDANNIRWADEAYDIYGNYTLLDAEKAINTISTGLNNNTAWINNHQELVGIATGVITGVTDIAADADHRIYVEGGIVKLPSDAESGSLTLYTIDGKALLHSTEPTLDITSLSSGIYIISASFPDAILTQKIVKK